MVFLAEFDSEEHRQTNIERLIQLEEKEKAWIIYGKPCFTNNPTNKMDDQSINKREIKDKLEVRKLSTASLEGIVDGKKFREGIPIK